MSFDPMHSSAAAAFDSHPDLTPPGFEIAIGKWSMLSDDLTDLAFAIGFRRVTALTLPDNLASQKTLLNAGFELETVLRDGMTKRDGNQTNAVLFAKFPDVHILD